MIVLKLICCLFCIGFVGTFFLFYAAKVDKKK